MAEGATPPIVAVNGLTIVAAAMYASLRDDSGEKTLMIYHRWRSSVEAGEMLGPQCVCFEVCMRSTARNSAACNYELIPYEHD